jgi:hypothetical protein
MWKHFSQNSSIDTTLFAGHQILLSRSKEYLQYSVYNLNNAAAEFSTEINTERNKITALR